jgi:hypothetical protein
MSNPHRGLRGLVRWVVISVGVVLVLSACSTRYQGNAADLMPGPDQLAVNYKLTGQDTSCDLDLGKKAVSCLKREYTNSDGVYAGASFQIFVYEDDQSALVQYDVLKKLLIDSKDVPKTEDMERGKLAGANEATLLYATDNTSSATAVYQRVWLVFRKNNITVISYSGGAGLQAVADRVLADHIEEATTFAEMILDKIP